METIEQHATMHLFIQSKLEFIVVVVYCDYELVVHRENRGCSRIMRHFDSLGEILFAFV